MKRSFLPIALLATLAFSPLPARATELAIATGSTGIDVKILREMSDRYEKATGNKVKIVTMPASTTDQFEQYKVWLSAGSSDVDVYLSDGQWAPQLASPYVDLSDAVKDVIKGHFPAIVASQTVDGRLVGMPFYTDAPALFYRKDLLDKYKQSVPKTWAEMASEAKLIEDGERAAGNKDMWGFVFQGNAYEGLTCDALEWVKSYGGGVIVEQDGTISVDNPKAVAALEGAKSWIDTIAPPGVLAYMEDESRGVWQTGNAVFMRNWPYAYSLGNSEGSRIKGLFDVTTLPDGGGGSAATLGGRSLAVSKYSKHPKEAIELVKWLASPDMQKLSALEAAHLPTIVALYDDPDIAKAQPVIPRWKNVVLNAVARPATVTKLKYNEVSADFWSAVHNTLAGDGTAAANLKALKAKLTELKGSGW